MTGRPHPGEYADYAQPDIEAVRGTDAVAVLEELARETHQLLAALRDEQVGKVRYAPDRWTLKEVLGHLVDDERVFAYRLFCVARGETTPLPGFDERVYAAHSNAEARRWEELLEEYRVVRAATLTLLRSLPPEAWLRTGEVNGYRATPRGLAFHIAGHELRHLRSIRERYLPMVATPRR